MNSSNASTEILIRSATEQDAHELPEIERSAGEIFRQWPGLEWIADDEVQTVEQHQTLVASGISLVAERIGLGPIAFLNGEESDGCLHLWQIAVHSRYQGRGLGRELIANAELAAWRRGIRAVTLTTFRYVPWNEPYYTRLGFQILHEGELTARLRTILDNERLHGLPVDLRCAMVKKLRSVETGPAS